MSGWDSSGLPTDPEYDPAVAPLAQRHSATSVEAGRQPDRRDQGRHAAGRHLPPPAVPHGDGGYDEEAQEALGLPGYAYRPRRVELQNAGLVVDSRRVRLTRNKRRAVVWYAVYPEGPDPWEEE